MSLFPDLHYQTQNEVLRQLAEVKLSSAGMEQLSLHLDMLSESQLKEVISLLKENQESISKNTIAHLVGLTHHQNPVFAEVAYHALQDLAPQNAQAQKAIETFENNNPY